MPITLPPEAAKQLVASIKRFSAEHLDEQIDFLVGKPAFQPVFMLLNRPLGRDQNGASAIAMAEGADEEIALGNGGEWMAFECREGGF